MASKFATALTVILTIATESINISYHGPFRSEASDYFEQELANMDRATIPELQCTPLFGSAYNSLILQGLRIRGIPYNQIDDEYKKVSYLLDSTTSEQPVKYYKFTLTSYMKKFYISSLSLSTCCDVDIADYNDESLKTSMTDAYQRAIFDIANYNKDEDSDDYCSSDYDNNSSLDTMIYLLQEKKGQINVIAQKDDSSCTNSEKSYINLYDYPEGEYIIAVGGYGTEIGNFWIHLQCVKYMWPIEEDQVDPPVNVTTITCMDTKHGWVSKDFEVQYIRFDITETTYFPIDIRFDDNTTKYLVKSSTSVNGLNEYEIMEAEPNDPVVFVVDDEEMYTYGTYYIMIQFYPITSDNNMTYEVSITCGDPPTEYPTVDPTIFPTQDPTQQPTISPTVPPKLPRNVMVGLVFGSMGTLLTLLLVYYAYNLCKYYKDKHNEKDPAHMTKEISANKSKSKSIDKSVGFTSLNHGDESGVNIIELTGPGTNTEQQSIVSVDLDAEDQDDINKEHEHEKKIEPKKMNGKSIKGISIRRLDSDLALSSQMSQDEDVVQAVLAHAISCCEEEEDFDIFQVLAIRKYDPKSREVRAIKPLSKLGINVEVIRLSPYIETLFTAVIIALSQTWGISVVVYKLVDAYFEDAVDSVVCDMDVERWEDVFSLKVLALLLSLIVTFFIGVLLNGVRHNGLYEIMHRLELKHIKRVNNIGLWIVQLGQAVNYYVCCAAVLGSYFIIFRSNQSEDGDYSAAGLDMILNCVALFFMLELDDLMVSDDDYEVCGEHLRSILNDYTPDLTINEVYASKDHVMDNNDEDPNQTEKSISDGRSASMIEDTWTKCSAWMVPFMYYFVNTFAIFTAFCCYAGGFVAPFVIFFCW